MVGTPRRDRLTRARTLADLAARIEAIEHKHIFDGLPGIPTGWREPLARLACGVLHEWLCPAEARGREWTAPVLLFAHMARRCIEGEDQSDGRCVVWIGRRVWPQPPVLLAGANDVERRLLRRSLLVDPPTNADRLWAIDLCLRSPAVAVAIADAGGMKLAHSRRLQLAAESGAGGGGALALLARPAGEITTPSAAAMRWRIEPIASPTTAPRWGIELVRCKGVQRFSGTEAHAPLVLEHDRETGCVRVPPDLADRSNQATQRLAIRRTA